MLFLGRKQQKIVLLFGKSGRAQPGDAPFHVWFAAALVGEAAIGAFEMPVHLGGGASEGGFDIGGLVGDNERAMTFGAGFEHTAFALWAGLFGAFVAGEVYLDAGEVGVETLQEVVDIGSDGVGELGVH